MFQLRNSLIEMNKKFGFLVLYSTLGILINSITLIILRHWIGASNAQVVFRSIPHRGVFELVNGRTLLQIPILGYFLVLVNSVMGYSIKRDNFLFHIIGVVSVFLSVILLFVILNIIHLN